VIFGQNCYTCNNLGWRVEHQQGDPVPDQPGVFYLDTLWVQCTCRTFVMTTIVVPTVIPISP